MPDAAGSPSTARDRAVLGVPEVWVLPTGQVAIRDGADTYWVVEPEAEDRTLYELPADAVRLIPAGGSAPTAEDERLEEVQGWLHELNEATDGPMYARTLGLVQDQAAEVERLRELASVLDDNAEDGVESYLRLGNALDQVRAERNKARAEVERMRPVVEAVEVWNDKWMAGEAGVSAGTELHNVLVKYLARDHAAVYRAGGSAPHQGDELDDGDEVGPLEDYSSWRQVQPAPHQGATTDTERGGS